MSYPSPDTCLILPKGDVHSDLLILLLELGLWDISVMWMYVPSLESFYVAAIFKKHLNRLKQTCTAFLALSSLLGSTEPQNLKVTG